MQTQQNFIDIRSDTVTHPTPKMRESMLYSKVGDDVFQQDPTVIELEELTAQMVGKEASIFMVTGVMANQIAVLTHLKGVKGLEIILSQKSHIAKDENGAVGVISSAAMKTVAQKENGEMDIDDIDKAIRKIIYDFTPRTGLICLENTTGGKAVSMEYMQNVYKLAQENNLPVHIDGARAFNAAIALGVDIKEIAKNCDSISFCLSKGLCCPIGSMLSGTKEFITQARRFRKMLGGSCRQVGVVAGPGIVALKEQLPLLKKDHEMAKKLHSLLSNIKEITLDPYESYCTNMVFFIFKEEKYNLTPLNNQFEIFMYKNGIKISPTSGIKGDKYRLVMNFYVNDVEVQNIYEGIKEYVNTLPK